MKKRNENSIGKSMPVDLEVWFGSPFVQYMKDYQRWWFFSLCANAWRNKVKPGYVAADRERLWMLAGAKTRQFFEGDEDGVQRCAIVIDRFESTDDGLWLFNRKLLDVYERQLAKYNSWTNNGLLGGRPKGSKSKPNQNQLVTSGCDYVCCFACGKKLKERSISHNGFIFCDESCKEKHLEKASYGEKKAAKAASANGLSAL